MTRNHSCHRMTRKCYRPEETDGRCLHVNNDGTCGHQVIIDNCLYMSPSIDRWDKWREYYEKTHPRDWPC